MLIDAKLSIKYSMLVEKVCRVHKFAFVFDIIDFQKNANLLKIQGKCRLAHAANDRQPTSISHYFYVFGVKME